jgi:hypothetical protein
MNVEPELVADPAAVTAEWLDTVLRHSGALTDGKVESFTAEPIGTGQVGANIRYRLTYAGTGDGPASVVAKFASQDAVSRSTGIQTLTYETEVAFYRDLAATVDISRPACHFAAVVPGTADVVLVLEDLAPSVQGDQLAGCSVEQAALAIDEAARLHGPRWNDRSLLDLPWLAGRVTGGDDAAGMTMLFGMLWDGFVERYATMLEPESITIGQHFRANCAAWFGHVTPTLTITHGDYRIDNMLFASEAGGRPLTVVDWQTVRLGCGTSDVSYFLSAGVDSAVRRDIEPDLVRRYHAALRGYGVDGYDFDACWNDYRRFSYAGFVMAVIASMIVGRTDRGDAMFMAMANRAAAQIADLGADEFVAG